MVVVIRRYQTLAAAKAAQRVLSQVGISSRVLERKPGAFGRAMGRQARFDLSVSEPNLSRAKAMLGKP
jgi:hypothetical protein